MVTGKQVAEQVCLGAKESITDQSCAHFDLLDACASYRPLLFQGCDSVAECCLFREKHIYDRARSIVGIGTHDDLWSADSGRSKHFSGKLLAYDRTF